MSWLWHGFNLDRRRRTNQCYYEWNCLVCFTRTVVAVMKLRWRLHK